MKKKTFLVLSSLLLILSIPLLVNKYYKTSVMKASEQTYHVYHDEELTKKKKIRQKEGINNVSAFYLTESELIRRLANEYLAFYGSLETDKEDATKYLLEEGATIEFTNISEKSPLISEIIIQTKTEELLSKQLEEVLPVVDSELKPKEVMALIKEKGKTVDKKYSYTYVLQDNTYTFILKERE